MLVTLTHLRDSWMDRMITHVLYLPHQAMLRIQHFNTVVTRVRIHRMLALRYDESRRIG
jgi:hypothetical protein